MMTTTLKIHLAQIFTKTTSAMHLKVPIALFVGMGDFLIGAENFVTMGMLVLLIIFDFITSIMSKYKTGETIESRKALKTVTKIFIYTMFVSGTYLTEQIIPGTTFLDNAVISFLAITELISIIENIGHMGYAIPKKLLNKLETLQKSR